jgi:hypothetical protein
MNETAEAVSRGTAEFPPANKDTTLPRGGGEAGRMGWRRCLCRRGRMWILVCMCCIIGRMCGRGGCGGVWSGEVVGGEGWVGVFARQYRLDLILVRF